MQEMSKDGNVLRTIDAIMKERDLRLAAQGSVDVVACSHAWCVKNEALKRSSTIFFLVVD